MTTVMKTTATTAAASTQDIFELDRRSPLSTDYNKIIKGAGYGNMDAIKELAEYWQERSQNSAESAARVMENFRRNPNGRRPNNKFLARFRQEAALTAQLHTQAQKVSKQAEYIDQHGAIGEIIDRSLLVELISHDVTTTPYMKKFSQFDILRFLRGTEVNGFTTSRRGIANVELPGYAIVQPDDEGFLLKFKDDEILISGEQLHYLIMDMDQSTYQDIPFSSAGVFETTTSRANYDGITLVVRDVTIEDENGTKHELGTIRVSMEYKVFKVMTHALLFGLYPERTGYAKYKVLNDIILKIFGDRKHFLKDRFEMEQAWRAILTYTMRDSNKVEQMKSQQLVDAAFAAGTPLSYLDIKTEAMLLDSARFKECLLKSEAEQKERRAQRQEARGQQAQTQGSPRPTQTGTSMSDAEFDKLFGAEIPF